MSVWLCFSFFFVLGGGGDGTAGKRPILGTFSIWDMGSQVKPGRRARQAGVCAALWVLQGRRAAVLSGLGHGRGSKPMVPKWVPSPPPKWVALETMFWYQNGLPW